MTILAGQDSYRGTTKNGISSGSWQSYPGSFRINSVQKTTGSELHSRARDAMRYDYGARRDAVGESRVVELVGAVGGYVWGTDVYTSDSTLAAAAVHAGVLEVGEKAKIRVTTLEGRESYDGSTRPGVTSSSYGGYPQSIRLERVDESKSSSDYRYYRKPEYPSPR